MYCPRCGQQQVSDSARFCSRCGFRLDFVTELLLNDGVLLVSEAAQPEAKQSSKRRGTRQGAKIMFIGGVLFPLAVGLSIAVDGPAPLLIPFTVGLAGLAWFLYFVLFGEDDTPATDQRQSRRYVPPQRRVTLPPPQGEPVTGAGPRRVNTADMAEPPTVTEKTTRFFEEK
ncbi:MAG TPA: zinc ribbon domain-containing protein [Blastocatellia bacterium]|nr:zinc ribbon domain-containing protein [Blastocatellia bacterium]